MKTIRSKLCKNGNRINLVEADTYFLLIGITSDGTAHKLQTMTNKWDNDREYAVKRYKGECLNNDHPIYSYRVI